MRQGWLAGIALLGLLAGVTPAFAQGGGGNDVNEEVRRAVERAVGASVSTSVAESLSRSIVSEGTRQAENTTVFFSSRCNRPPDMARTLPTCSPPYLVYVSTKFMSRRSAPSRPTREAKRNRGGRRFVGPRVRGSGGG